MAIGIELCNIPHISLHCPKKQPCLLICIDDWFNLPGYASHFIPKEGHAYECITSPDDTINLICVSSGTITLLSTSNILNFPSSKSDSGIRYESYTISSSFCNEKSGYS